MYYESSVATIEASSLTADEIAQQVGRLGMQLLDQANPYKNGIKPAPIHSVRLPNGLMADALDETIHSSRAFKTCGLYGPVYFSTSEARATGKPISEHHIASAGNAALAAAIEGNKHGILTVAHVPQTASDFKVQALKDKGAKVLPVYANVDEAIEGARLHGNTLGNHELHAFNSLENLASISTTIGQEIVDLAQNIRTQSEAKICVVLPLGGGSMAAGVAIALHKARIDNLELITSEVEETINGNTLTKDKLPFCDGTAAKTGSLTAKILDDKRFRQGALKVRTDQVANSMLRLPSLLGINHDIEPAGALAHTGTVAHSRYEKDSETKYIFVVSGSNVSEATKMQALELGMRGCGAAPL